MKIDKTKFLELYNNGLNDCQIASQLGMTSMGVRYWRAVKYNLPPHYDANSVVDHDVMLSLYNEGHSDQDMGKIAGVHPLTARNWRLRNGLKANFEKGWPHKNRSDNYLKGFEPDDKDKPWRDPESLFCDTKFLETLFKKQIKQCGTNA